MKNAAFALSLLLASAGCSFGESEENLLENDIRAVLGNQGATVQQVEMTRQDDDHMNGFADVRAGDGSEGRLNCTATRDPSKGARYFDWRCNPAIDQRALDRMEAQIRETITARGGEVRQVELSRVDDSHMRGFAIVADPSGGVVRANCTATRENEASAQFNWECTPEGEAPAGGGKE